jgi:hypothetical protein
MKVLFVGLARSIRLFNTSLLNPFGLSLQPVFDQLARKYSFAQFPKHPLDYDDQKALTFKSGTFLNSKNVPVMVSFSIYNDGVVANTTSSTDDSDDFLVEVMDWINGEFGLRPPSDVRQAYLSQIDVEFPTPLIQLNPKLNSLLTLIQRRVTNSDGKMREFSFTGISFWTEDINKPNAPAPIKFERKFSAPFSTNHYFSQAPMKTSEHLKFLDELEEILKS